MGVPHDTPADQQKLNEAIAKRDEFKNLDEPRDDWDPKTSEAIPEPKVEAIVIKSDVTSFKIRKLKTGLCLIYDGEEHFFSSKTGLIKHLNKEVL